MAISFASAQGNLFNALGRLGKLVDELKSYQDSQLTNTINQATGVVGQYNANPDIQAIMGANYISLLDAAGSNIAGVVQTMATQTVNRFVYDDAPRLNQTLTSDATLASMQEIIRQMTQQGATVLAQTVTATPGAFQGTGNGTLCMSVRRPSDGRVLENSFAETMNVICSQDSYTGGATAGQETFNVTGTGAENNVFGFDWPLGSNASTVIQMIDGGSSESGGNLLNNSSFADWTDDVPDQWEVITGTPGTDIIEAVGAGYATGSALEFVGDGSTLVGIRQAFDDDGGNTTTIDPVTQYAVCVFIRRGGTAATQGNLQIALTNELNVPLQDMAGNSCELDIDLTGVSTAWIPYTMAFRSPYILPTGTLYLQIQFTTAPDAGVQIYMDRVSFGFMSQIYVGGPWIAGFSGNANFVVNDQSQVVITNSRGSGGSLSTFQTLMWRLLPVMAQNELLLPSSAAPSISDTLITG